MDVCAYLKEHRAVELSGQQTEALKTDAAKTLLLAVPGAGKTTVVTARVGRLLLEEGYAGSSLLILTYNRAAARDMERRWDSFFGECGVEPPTFSTIHSFCYRTLGEYARLRGNALPKLIEGDERGGKNRVVSGIYREMTGQFLPEDQLSQVINLMGYCVNMQSPPEDADTAGELEFFPELCRRYTAWKRENSSMDFDDMLLFAYTALLRSGQLRERVATRYSHILVDEAQDTSRLQQEIIALLLRDNLFMVGDEDQSIYGFRGAYPKGLTGFFERYGDAQLMKLEQNYRSTPEIVAAAGRLISHNTLRFSKNIFTCRAAGSEVKVVTELTIEQQYRAIAGQCAELLGSGSVAVLYRNSYSGIGLALELSEMGLHYTASETRIGYSSDFISRDISNILRLAQNPGDAQAFRQVYFRLGCGLNREIERMANAEPREDIIDWIVNSSEKTDRSTGRLLFTKRILAGMRKKAPHRQLEDIIEELGYLDTLEKHGPSGYLMSGPIQRLAIISRMARDCEDTAALLERMSDAEKLLQGDGMRGIRLSTVHSAKGQEYDHVIIADALEGIFPDTQAVEYGTLGGVEQSEEETRLFYTAMTRAKDTLTIYAPEDGFGRELLPSRYIELAGLSAGVVSVNGAREGSDVSHTFFGAGRITEINRARKLFTVDFRHYGRKTFGLESLGDSKLFKLFQ